MKSEFIDKQLKPNIQPNINYFLFRNTVTTQIHTHCASGTNATYFRNLMRPTSGT